jgi:hypothetical protein
LFKVFVGFKSKKPIWKSNQWFLLFELNVDLWSKWQTSDWTDGHILVVPEHDSVESHSQNHTSNHHNVAYL